MIIQNCSETTPIIIFFLNKNYRLTKLFVTREGCVVL